MAKSKSKFVCQQCGFESPKWLGRCNGCNQWNAMEEELVATKAAYKRSPSIVSQAKPQPIGKVKSGSYQRFDTSISELNRVLGGGLVKGALTLISGEPGIGKSTLILQAGSKISKKYGTVLYISGEESEEQIKMRADRLDSITDKLYVISETNISVIEGYINELSPVFVIIDSVQTLFKDELTSAPGSVSQIKESVNNLMRIGKSLNIPIFLVAHVTKQGDLAGPRVLEHMVDTVLHFEGERTQEFRILRALKNRFGTTSEIGVFEMKEEGLIEVTNPSAMLLDSMTEEAEGAIVVATVEGTRPILVELQALVTATNTGFPRRTAVGVDINRLNLIIAVLEKKMGLPLINYDIYINVVGGIKLEGTFGDLGIAMAIYSSYKSINLPTKRLIAIGEISLTADIRTVPQLEKMIKEGEKMGFEECILPKRNRSKVGTSRKMRLIEVENLYSALKHIEKTK
ncbi:DNA repair protein RadA [Alkaliphilus pronyensis]|uniref:DNA repair protein RadA n=1 Tax=Alkaliphilus pronyensis TaxID=1482732 RepID=A0A6I0F6W4_9FIRM|nr:DNA repair protein RadA [Alkaliphilus pronyensis]KAB3533594.1 DNA repair protein RadA [Alkaliphilus pronyensis]